MGAQLIGVILVIVAIATGKVMGGADGTAHPGLGIALIAGLGVQVVLGSFAHWSKGSLKGPTTSSGRGTFHFAHIGLGLVVIILGWATALTGFLQQWVGEFGAGFGQFILGWKIIFGVFIGVFGLAYIVAVVALPAAVHRGETGEPTRIESSEKQLDRTAHVA